MAELQNMQWNYVIKHDPNHVSFLMFETTRRRLILFSLLELGGKK